MEKYVVVHPVRHDGKLYDRGAIIPSEKAKLSEEEALNLVDLGVIKAADVVVVQQVVAGPSTAETLASYKKLLAMNISELVEYGKATYGLVLNPEEKKETIVAAIHDMYVASLTAPAGEFE